MAVITSTNGAEILIDDEDLERVSQHTWNAFKTNSCPRRSIRVNGKVRNVPLSHFVLNVPLTVDQEIRTRNGNSYDCRKANLYVKNRKPARGASSSYFGVHRHRDGGWVATYKRKYLGIFESEEAAARVWDEAALADWDSNGGKRPHLNFPPYRPMQSDAKLHTKGAWRSKESTYETTEQMIKRVVGADHPQIEEIVEWAQNFRDWIRGIARFATEIVESDPAFGLA